MQIVAIGGGEIKTKETLRIDRFIVDLTGASSPKALFIPTASGDAEGYCETFEKIYGRILGCRTDRLCLLSCPDDRTRIREKILGADLVYVGGGNTLRMMCLWRRLGIDRVLKEAGRRGVVLSGLSAGAICWHEWGHSDSRASAGKPDWAFLRVTGLGLSRGMFCPHLDAEKRKGPFSAMVLRHRCLGLACDNNAAIWYDGDRATVKTSRQYASAYAFRPRGNRAVIDEYRAGDEIEGLLK